MNITIYTTLFVGTNNAGCARGPVILIRPEYRGDTGLLEHEKTHVWQFWRTFGLHSFLYLFSKSYRLKAEVEAYRVQLTYASAQALRFAGFLSANYGLDISQEDALKLLIE